MGLIRVNAALIASMSGLKERRLSHRAVIFRVGDVLHPGHVVAVERFMHRDVDHTRGWCGAMRNAAAADRLAPADKRQARDGAALQWDRHPVKTRLALSSNPS
jgi:hypothetical protein